MHETLEPSGAVAEMLAKDGTLDDILSGRGLRFDPAPVVPPVEPPPEFRIEPVDWDEEMRERQEAERAERERQASARSQEFVDQLEAKSLQPTPAPRRRRLRDLLGRETP